MQSGSIDRIGTSAAKYQYVWLTSTTFQAHFFATETVTNIQINSPPFLPTSSKVGYFVTCCTAFPRRINDPSTPKIRAVSRPDVHPAVDKAPGPSHSAQQFIEILSSDDC